MVSTRFYKTPLLAPKNPNLSFGRHLGARQSNYFNIREFVLENNLCGVLTLLCSIS